MPGIMLNAQRWIGEVFALFKHINKVSFSAHSQQDLCASGHSGCLWRRLHSFESQNGDSASDILPSLKFYDFLILIILFISKAI